MEVVPVVAGCLVRDGKILLANRIESNSPETIGMLEMPGGKVEEGETPEEALMRELEEELGVVVQVKELLYAKFNKYSSGITYLVLFYHCEILGRKSEGEGLEIKWVYPHNECLDNTLPGTQEALRELISRGDW